MAGSDLAHEYLQDCLLQPKLDKLLDGPTFLGNKRKGEVRRFCLSVAIVSPWNNISLLIFRKLVKTEIFQRTEKGKKI